MGEHLAPYVSMTEGFNNLFQKKGLTEGFTDMTGLFNTILTSGSAPEITRAVCSQSSGSGSTANCPPTATVIRKSSSTGTGRGTGTGIEAPTAFLKTIIQEEQATADSLMDTAKRINPVAQTVTPKPAAYDAAFESDKNPGLPRAGATLQGFAILLLIISYIALTMVTTIAVNTLTQNAYSAGKTFIAFIILGVIIFSLITRLG